MMFEWIPCTILLMGLFYSVQAQQKCADKSPNCAPMKQFCHMVPVQAACQKTCGICKGCADKFPNCVRMKQFCHMVHMQAACQITCGICKELKDCIFNEKEIAVGQVASQLVENCAELLCSHDGMESRLVLQNIDGCTHKVPATPGPATLVPAPSKCQYGEKFGAGHTMALVPNADCKFHKSGVTEEEKRIILRTHNELRTKVALGNEMQGNPGPQPAASNMREMVWNDQLALVAQAWAEQCPKGHDLGNNRRICDSSYRAVGQNIFNNFGHVDRQLWDKAVQAWYGEVEYMPNTDVGAYQTPPTGMIGHYTQVVWAKTYEVGCGAIYYSAVKKGVTYPNSKKYICNYGSAGNYRKASLYKAGEPASNCENGKSTTYPFLCA